MPPTDKRPAIFQLALAFRSTGSGPPPPVEPAPVIVSGWVNGDALAPACVATMLI
jgi:hypothetical protein